tara:strand:+ start:11254 stop:11796 length:543 start_codon:yes stop_codon:yes gene_type:complete
VITAKDIITFWFSELSPKQWWQKDAQLDLAIAQRFLPCLQQAASCELFSWRNSALGRLAEVIVLDQFSRNVYRDTAQAFASDPLALALTQEAISLGCDQELSPIQRSFLYMPFMHSESAAIHEVAVTLFKANDEPENYQFELKHKAIIDRFGRYPHRNIILGRTSSAEEIDFLKQPGSSF